MRSYTAIIFDLDGTLLNTLDDLADGVNIALTSHGFPNRSIEEVRMAVGNGVARLMEAMIPQGKDNPDFENCLATFRAAYAQIARNKTAPYAGIPEMLAQLSAAGCKLAVVSNKFHDAVCELVQYYFPSIPVAVGEREDMGIRKKPAPDTVFAVMQQLDVPPAECVYIGDSDVDIATAQNAGIDCISVTWGFRDRAFLLDHGATTFADSPAELAQMLCCNKA